MLMTQDQLDLYYVDGPAAAKMLNVTSNQVRFLCAKGKLIGALKLGTSGWIIPRESVVNYKPGRRGPKPKTPRREDDIALVAEALKKSKEGARNDQ